MTVWRCWVEEPHARMRRVGHPSETKEKRADGRRKCRSLTAEAARDDSAFDDGVRVKLTEDGRTSGGHGKRRPCYTKFDSIWHFRLMPRESGAELREG
jgi:hypothetical protein